MMYLWLTSSILYFPPEMENLTKKDLVSGLLFPFAAWGYNKKFQSCLLTGFGEEEIIRKASTSVELYRQVREEERWLCLAPCPLRVLDSTGHADKTHISTHHPLHCEAATVMLITRSILCNVRTHGQLGGTCRLLHWHCPWWSLWYPPSASHSGTLFLWFSSSKNATYCKPKKKKLLKDVHDLLVMPSSSIRFPCSTSVTHLGRK